ncbi:hypothetical protein EC973_008753 [Apophysomyces ossiformis]|uniref:Uncharacterized protein n=1 Tax=Apophysomyces ossiformis TaxID=679940 RepID=A0A8H7EQ07_9FUNG|nr:hypothetical protein EC973_008753 [Apophysomyces ossiformis]
MPGPATLFTLGAVGAAGAVAAYARRSSQGNVKTDELEEGKFKPYDFARRRSSGVKNDLWESRSQADHLWRREYGASFSHNSYPRFPGSKPNKPTK